MKSADPPGVDAATLAAFLSCSVGYVYTLAAMPGFPARPAPGRFDLLESAKWETRRLKVAINPHGPSDGPKLRSAKLALMRGQAEKVSMENHVRRGDLVERDALMALWFRRVSNCQKRVRAVAPSVGPTLTNKPESYCTEKLRVAIDAALHELDGPAGGDAKPRRDGRRRR